MTGSSLLQAGIAAIEQREYHNAESLLGQAVDQDSFNYLANLRLSEAAHVNKNWGLAISSALRAVAAKHNGDAAEHQAGLSIRSYFWEHGYDCQSNQSLDDAFDHIVRQHSPALIVNLNAVLKDRQLVHSALVVSSYLKRSGFESLSPLDGFGEQACAIDAIREKLLKAISAQPDDLNTLTEYANFLGYNGDRLAAEQILFECFRTREWLLPEELGFRVSHDWFSHNIPVWNQFVRPYRRRKGIRVLEVGSYEGLSTAWLFLNVVKPAEGTIDSVDIQYGPHFHHNWSAFDPDGLVNCHEQDSRSWFMENADRAYDMIYIDGAHDAESAGADVEAAWQLLDSNGILIVDDYAGFSTELKFALDRFLRRLGEQAHLIHSSYQIILSKK